MGCTKYLHVGAYVYLSPGPFCWYHPQLSQNRYSENLKNSIILETLDQRLQDSLDTLLGKHFHRVWKDPRK